MANIAESVQRWMQYDQDPTTRSEIESLVQEKNNTELEERLSHRLTFGTAGLRARMGAGFSRLNGLTIIQTTQGLAEHLLSTFTNTRAAGVVIGYDARHNSKKFAQLAASVFESKGITVWWYDDFVHTPLVPYTVDSKRAAAGVMITASHNPADDNGYKVYASNGCQINSPDDALIAASILRNLEPTVWRLQGGSLRRTVSLESCYNRSIREHFRLIDSGNTVQFVYTPMHGVGLRYMENITNELGLREMMIVVGQQAQPDPDFPTVRYPNPEEDGALDLAKSLADERGLTLVFANDPDADRFAAAEKVHGAWHQFTGDQVGALLAHWVSTNFGPFSKDDIMLTSAVSSQMLSYMAEAEGFTVQETLTGFKWLGNVAKNLKERGKNVHFAYEEALGYMFPQVVFDKDGVTAAMIFLQACREWSGSPWAKLQGLYQKYGFFVTSNTYWRSPSIQKTQMLFQRLRNLEQPFPSRINQRIVIRYRDLSTGYDSASDNGIPNLPVSAGAQMISYWLDGSGTEDDGMRFTIRASGTEPKVKIYLECRSKDQESAENGALDLLRWLNRAWFSDPELTIEDKYATI